MKNLIIMVKLSWNDFDNNCDQSPCQDIVSALDSKIERKTKNIWLIFFTKEYLLFNYNFLHKETENLKTGKQELTELKILYSTCKSSLFESKQLH